MKPRTTCALRRKRLHRKLTAWSLPSAAFPVIAGPAATAERLQAELSNVPELKGHDYSCVSVTTSARRWPSCAQGKKS